jgi:hypothetical protein
VSDWPERHNEAARLAAISERAAETHRLLWDVKRRYLCRMCGISLGTREVPLCDTCNAKRFVRRVNKQ